MAMLITKFHKLIRNRILWIIFLVVVVFSFVIWGTQMPDSGAQGPNAAGQLDGEDISFEVYQRARFNTYLSVVLMTGRQITITPEVEEQLHTMAWQRIATLREAGKLGIAASNDEVVNSIRSFEFLQTEDRRFSTQAYDQFAQNFLAQFRASKRDFEEHVRQEIILQKFRMMIDRSQLISPLEVSRTFDTLTDTFTVEYVQIPVALVADTVEVADEDVQAFFGNDPEQFMMPEKVKVKAAVFAIADFLEQVEITADEIEEYYDFNLEEFAKPAAESEPEENVFALNPTEYRPLEEVRDEISAILRQRQATLLAEEKAGQFVQELSYQRSAGQAAFDQLAATEGIQLIMTAPFAAPEVPSELEGATPAINRAAFNLTDDDDYYYSDPILAGEYVYVLALVERSAARVPEFEEVREEAEAMAREFAVYQALAEKAREIQGSAIAGLSAGLSFEEIMDEYKLTTMKPEPFTVNTQNLDPVITASLIRPLLVLNAGEVTDIINASDSVLIGYVKERTPAADMSLNIMRDQIINTLRQQNSGTVFSGYQDYLLEQQGFKDFTRRNRAGDNGESDS